MCRKALSAHRVFVALFCKTRTPFGLPLSLWEEDLDLHGANTSSENSPPDFQEVSMVRQLLENTLLEIFDGLRRVHPSSKSEQALAWVFNEKDGREFSFNHVCMVLKFEPPYFRRVLHGLITAVKTKKRRIPRCRCDHRREMAAGKKTLPRRTHCRGARQLTEIHPEERRRFRSVK